MFGIGYQEMFLIMVVALVIFGPGKLPEVAGQIGRAVRDFRRMTADLTGEFEKSIAEVDDVRQSVRKEMTSMRAEVEGVSKSVKKDLDGLNDGLGKTTGAKGGAGRTATKPAALVAKTANTATKSASSAVAKAKNGHATGTIAPLPAATKADPLSDVSMLDADPEPVATPKVAPTATAADTASIKSAKMEPATAKVAATATKPVSASTNGKKASAKAKVDAAEDIAGDDALARARQRRAAAGYSRRS